MSDTVSPSSKQKKKDKLAFNAKIAREYAEGLSSVVLAKRYQMGTQTVLNIVRGMGVPVRKAGWTMEGRVEKVGPLYDEGCTVGEIVAKTGYKRETVLRTIGYIIDRQSEPEYIDCPLCNAQGRIKNPFKA